MMPNAPRGIGRPAPGTPGVGAAAGFAGALALYDALSQLYAAMQAVRAEDAAYWATVQQAIDTSGTLSRAEIWVSWLNGAGGFNPNGIRMRDTYNCIENHIVDVQNEIDRLTNITSPTMADYAQLGMLKQVLSNFQQSEAYFRQLRSDFINYPNQPLPNLDQVNSFTCESIPVETAPFPTATDPATGTQMATVPDLPPSDYPGPLLNFPPYPREGPLFPDSPPSD
jgi:hypothetical protein